MDKTCSMGMDMDMDMDIDIDRHGNRLLPDRQGQPTLAEELAEVGESERNCL
jgi:hypothetical protein